MYKKYKARFQIFKDVQQVNKLNKFKILAIQILNILSVQIAQTEQTLNITLSWILNIQKCKTNEQTVQTEQSQNTIAYLYLTFSKL